MRGAAHSPGAFGMRAPLALAIRDAQHDLAGQLAAVQTHVRRTASGTAGRSRPLQPTRANRMARGRYRDRRAPTPLPQCPHPQDYRNVGLDCVAVTEALSRQLSRSITTSARGGRGAARRKHEATPRTIRRGCRAWADLLEREALVERDAKGTITSCNWPAMLHRWSDDYKFAGNPVSRYGRPSRNRHPRGDHEAPRRQVRSHRSARRGPSGSACTGSARDELRRRPSLDRTELGSRRG
jgi:hypothetical protein